MESLRILHVVPYYEGAWAYGGIPRVVPILARSLAARGHRVTVCTTDACDASVRLGGERPAGVGAISGPPRLLDVRGLEPPAPLVLVLERLDTLGPDDELVVVHDRRPMFLYPQLEDRGFTHHTDEPEPGVVHITIRRAKAAP